MTLNFPMLYALSKENIKEKLEYYQTINVTSCILITTKDLMQSVDLSYARYEFLKEKNIIITDEN